MAVYVTALAPTPTLNAGLLPAAHRLGLDVVLPTSQADAHRAVCRAAKPDLSR
ncbi:hypothetical protein GCM10010431_81170 [Streptomyces kunmingensis]